MIYIIAVEWNDSGAMRHRCVPLFLFVLLFSVHRKMVIVKSASLILTIMHANDNIMFIMEDTITHGISILHVCFLIKIRWCIIFTLVKV